MNPKLIQISLFLLLICLCKGYNGKKNNNNGNKIMKLLRYFSGSEINDVGEEVHKEQEGYDDQSLYDEQANHGALVVRDKNGKPVDKNNLKNNVKIVFIDLDGTLLNSHNKVSKLNLESLAKAHNKGIKIVFATGRPMFSVNDIMGQDAKKNNLSLIPGIYLNGCITYGPNGDIILDNYIDKKLIMDIYNFSKENNLVGRMFWNSLEKAHMFENNEYADQYLKIEPTMPDIIDEETLKNTKIYRILILLDEENLSSVLKMYQDKFSRRVFVDNTFKTYVEVIHHNATKFEGVKALCKHFNIRLNDALAIGDGENDIEMLQGVGTSIAVQNAPSKIKKCAKYVAPSNNDDAVHHAIQTFCDI
ncbi:haloacid dehalogenase-like hydrolase, putative [Plasmodium chabaudi chabaudi]|uniref:Haloacid dehalogenase-like hydrolase, putative n=1 Tax=Plasmodium chabaudi chabaudi TaxID=31271 RepID=Q7Z1C2_PLACU|nr:haloacid dehalogenase-like hydrolase, putative [Plasmodium chabaudi chabaudi]AAN78111.1 PC8A [Plasmodium chabaudi chabaudi]SCL92755.1 haloacid dehalogenase-like hydrolase, putative [Plasmodium chabaudi chabaudi]VTZ67855.1 haloacid dehalogenase-like hydrolase, putative [Plasmodium chabaudi chabaudi]|eukprot:XP_016654396.1 haloacid dehalogenase-like hydrolase, putative [Plasmodium chabaudi chabaudi]